MRFFSDPLYRNSFFLILTAGLMAVTGFAFWVLAARLYPAEDVGIAAAAIALAQLVAMFSRLGFDMGSIKFVHELDSGKVLRNSLTVVFLISLIASSVVVSQIGLISKKTAIILVFPYNVYFVFLVVAICTSGIICGGFFVAIRNTKNSFIQAISSTFRLVILPVIVFAGAIGVLFSFSVTPLISTFIGLILLKRAGYSFKPELDFQLVRSMFSYSFSNYISVVLEMLPGFVLPIMVVNVLGAKENAYFYIAWAIAGLLITIPRSTSMSLFAECSYSWTEVKRKVFRAMKFITLFVIPGIAFIYFAGNFLLSFFGRAYSENSLELLKVLVFAALPYSVNTVYAAICRARKRMGEVIAIFFTVSSITLVSAYILLGRIGLIGAGYAWLMGNFAAIVLVAFLAFRSVGFSLPVVFREVV